MESVAVFATECFAAECFVTQSSVIEFSLHETSPGEDHGSSVTLAGDFLHYQPPFSVHTVDKVCL